MLLLTLYCAVVFLGCWLQLSFCPASTGIIVHSPPGYSCAPYICDGAKGSEECAREATVGRRRLYGSAASEDDNETLYHPITNTLPPGLAGSVSIIA
eukprot:COSAG02_NODE_55313_length_291_cov_0.796875_1_plen_96_part_11